MKTAIVASLPIPQRLALSYAPGRSRELFMALFALDARLAGIVRQAREPMLAQMRLAWWRETLGKPGGERPSGEPLLAFLAAWEGEEAALSGLAEGWESLLAEPPFGEEEIRSFAKGRADAFAALARLAGAGGHADAARKAAHCWALMDLARGLSDPRERDLALALAEEEAAAGWALPRSLRPLSVLGGLARRNAARGGGELLGGPGDMLAALRLGLTGR
ncbi:MAG: hypothetical protein PHE36_08330 [Novosphingobium sp.]|nr:hypothetical protein [Novosphingobium sp.]